MAPGYLNEFGEPAGQLGRLVDVLPDWVSGDATPSQPRLSRKGALPAVDPFAEHVMK